VTPKYDRKAVANRLTWYLLCIFAFRIKILKGNPCAGFVSNCSYQNVCRSVGGFGLNNFVQFTEYKTCDITLEQGEESTSEEINPAGLLKK